MATYATLTARDLNGFEPEAKALVLEAIEKGALGRVSNSGHAILRAPDGARTASVPPHLKAANRGRKNSEAGVRRLFPETALGAAMADAVDSAAPSFDCPECGKAFKSDAARRGHVTGAHRKGGPTPCPECGRVFGSLNTMGIHLAMTHGIGRRGKTTTPRLPAPVPVNLAVGTVHYACPICGGVSASTRGVKNHARRGHGGAAVDPIRVDAPMPVAAMSSSARSRLLTEAPDATEAPESAPAPPDVPEAPTEAPSAPDAPEWVPIHPAPEAAPAPELDTPERLAQVHRDLMTPDAARDGLAAFLRDVLAEHAALKAQVERLTAQRDDLRVRLDLIREAVDL